MFLEICLNGASGMKYIANSLNLKISVVSHGITVTSSGIIFSHLERINCVHRLL